MNNVQDAINSALTTIFNWLPRLFGALIIILIGYAVAKWISKVLHRFFNRYDLNEKLGTGRGGNIVQRAVPDPAGLLASITFWLVIIGVVSLAATVLGIDALTAFVAAVYGYVPEIIGAIVIFLLGSAVAAGVARLVDNTMGDTPTGKMLESILPVVVIGITVFAIFDQLGIAQTVVTITYGAILGSVALASALAFGLGGRDVAARILETSYEKGRQNLDQVKRDLQTGRARAETQAEQVKSKDRRKR